MKLFIFFLLSALTISSYAQSLTPAPIDSVTEVQGAYLNSLALELEVTSECFSKIIGTVSDASNDGVWTIGVLTEQLPKEGFCSDASFVQKFKFESPQGAAITKINILGYKKNK